ncbi:MAG: N-acetylmuramoyl-L-alanine amidase [Dethiobacter sp.]|nr:N-acetylmuramoyl-L-alanine amidase [Dethiobacter sp.]
MSISKWLVLACALCVLSVLSMTGATLAQSTVTTSPGAEPRVISKTLEHGVPSAFLEWEEHQLFAVKGAYSFTGRSPVPFTGLSVGWLAGGPAEPRSFEVAIRTRKDEAPWTKWVHFRGDIGPGESPSNLFWSHLYTPLDFGVHTDYEIKISPPDGVPLTFVRVVVADNSAVPEATVPSEPLRAPEAITTLGAPAQPTIILRPQWLGAEHPWNVSQINITHAIVHHTVHHNIPRTEADSIQLMRDIRLIDHMLGKGWSDIGYHFVIDREGRIFQGRHNPQLNTQDVMGDHAPPANSRSVGIALMGQFYPGEDDPPVGHPSAAALRSLERLLAWRFHQRNLDPRGTANIATAWGTRNIHRIAGHREVSATACPGDNLQVLLPTIRTHVRSLLPPWLRVSPATISGSLLVGTGWSTIGTVNVTNPGGGTLSWSATDNRAWLRVIPISGTTATETDTVVVQATTSGLGFGTHTGAITFTGASPATNSPATVTVTLTIPTRPLGLQPGETEQPQ